jgi:hypothetical protein
MISNDAELNQSIEQLNRMYRAVAELRARVGSVRSPQFQLLTEGPVEEIRRLRQEIDTYLGVSAPDAVPAA